MILPTKHISSNNSLLGVGAKILSHLNYPRTVASLWSDLCKAPEIATFERFVLGLDLLYILGTIELREGILYKRQP